MQKQPGVLRSCYNLFSTLLRYTAAKINMLVCFLMKRNLELKLNIYCKVFYLNTFLFTGRCLECYTQHYPTINSYNKMDFRIK